MHSRAALCGEQRLKRQHERIALMHDLCSTDHGGIEVAALASPLSALPDTAALEDDHEPNG